MKAGVPRLFIVFRKWTCSSLEPSKDLPVRGFSLLFVLSLRVNFLKDNKYIINRGKTIFNFWLIYPDVVEGRCSI